MVICLFAKLFFAQYHNRLALKLLFAIWGPISRKVVPRKKNIYWQKRIYKGLDEKPFLAKKKYFFSTHYFLEN
jgi:hypothetical protein